MAVATVVTLCVSHGYGQQSISVQVDRWLSVQAVGGDVRYLNAQGSRPAQVGDYLTFVNDGLRTGNGSTGTLLVDTGVGTIQLLQDTEVRIQRLDFAADNGRITHLYVPRGQVRVSLRRFTHRGSELEIETPSGVSGVRGTEFGVTVQPDGVTGIVTREGAVATAAQRIQVLVAAGSQTIIRPGEAPLEPTPITPPTLHYRIDYRATGGRRRALLIGQVELVNRVYVDGQQQTLNHWGEFEYPLPATRGARVQVSVVSPLDEQEDYEIPLL
ncbi:MAG: FecR domain-containing protein [Cyanobacteria bacterium]|nr:FecR domain-containing protein [Cyanobacteriota bacterium]